MPLFTEASAWGTYPKVPHIFPIHSPFEVSHLQTSKVGNLWGTHGECNLGFPTSESLSTSAFREFCGEWGKKWITRIAKPHSDQGQRTDPPFCNKTIFLSFSLSFQNKSLSLRYRLLVPKGKAGGLILEKNLRPQFHTKN